jgi:hypothetical protein
MTNFNGWLVGSVDSQAKCKLALQLSRDGIESSKVTDERLAAD